MTGPDIASAPAPGLALWATDYPRSLAGYATLPLTAAMTATAPRGDGHPVLVLPGLSGTDLSTVVMRRMLSALGYDVHGWGLGRNLGPTRRATRGMRDLLGRLHDRTGERVTVVGWSLGGIFARQLARQTPERVRQVVTFGSPFRLNRVEQSNASHFFKLFERWHVEALTLPLEQDLERLAVPATSVYSRLDGICAWQTCLDEPGPIAENVEVCCSHFGFGHHPPALWVLADRLAQPEGEWARFEAPPHLDLAFPQAAA